MSVLSLIRYSNSRIHHPNDKFSMGIYEVSFKYWLKDSFIRQLHYILNLKFLSLFHDLDESLTAHLLRRKNLT